MSTLQLNLPIQYLKTVGPQRALILQKLGIYTIRDLLYHFPYRYEDRGVIRKVHTASQDEIVTVEGTVLGLQELTVSKEFDESSGDSEQYPCEHESASRITV